VASIGSPQQPGGSNHSSPGSVRVCTSPTVAAVASGGGKAHTYKCGKCGKSRTAPLPARARVYRDPRRVSKCGDTGPLAPLFQSRTAPSPAFWGARCAATSQHERHQICHLQTCPVLSW
jgi:hypothetical protein